MTRGQRGTRFDPSAGVRSRNAACAPEGGRAGMPGVYASVKTARTVAMRTERTKEVAVAPLAALLLGESP